MDEFIGRGWAYPVRADAKGDVALVSGAAEIEESIRLILGTSAGERPMRPDFGCGIHDLVFASVDSVLAGRVAYEVQTALGRWEPRIDVNHVDARVDEDEPSILYVHIEYSIRRRNDRRNLVFPFYVIPGER
jgi:phage baseplate assembly protein W